MISRRHASSAPALPDRRKAPVPPQLELRCVVREEVEILGMAVVAVAARQGSPAGQIEPLIHDATKSMPARRDGERIDVATSDHKRGKSDKGNKRLISL